MSAGTKKSDRCREVAVSGGSTIKALSVPTGHQEPKKGGFEISLEPDLYSCCSYVSPLLKKTDPWTGCSDDGILSHFDRSRTKLRLN